MRAAWTRCSRATTWRVLTANDNGWDRRRFEARLGYGVPAFGGTLTGTPEVAVGLSDTGRDYTLAWRLTPERSGPQTFEFRVEGLRRESVNPGSGVRSRRLAGTRFRYSTERLVVRPRKGGDGHDRGGR